MKNLRVEGYDSEFDYGIYSTSELINFMDEELGEGWFIVQYIVFSMNGKASFYIHSI